MSPFVKRLDRPEKYLYVFCVDADAKDNDFLAVIDVAKGSPSFAKVIHQLDLGSKNNETHHFGFNQDRSAAVPHALDQRRQRLIERFVPGAVDVITGQTETCGNTMDFRAGLSILRNADGITVVLDEEQNGQFLARRPIDGFKEFTFAGGAFSR